MINDNSCYSILNCIVVIEIIKMVHYESKRVFLSDCHLLPNLYLFVQKIYLTSQNETNMCTLGNLSLLNKIKNQIKTY